jgi:DNA-binding transcriptional LysR family regulator
MTLHQLRIFCAVAQAETLTRAAKQLGLTQPTLSQQLSKLEQCAEARLFDRTLSQMVLTDAGRFLLRHARFVLEEVDQAQTGLQEFSTGVRGVVRLAGANSIIRAIALPAIARLASNHPHVEFDIHETSPAETLDLLHNRSVSLGLIAADAVGQSVNSFRETPVSSDPYVLATPESLDLSNVADPEKDLRGIDKLLIGRCIQFNFGTQRSRQLEQWHQRNLPKHCVIAHCRSYETAISMVRAGFGVCVLPALAALDCADSISGVTLYATNLPPRQSVCLVPAQYLRVEPYKKFLIALHEAGRAAKLPFIRPSPPFMRGAGAARPSESHLQPAAAD